MTIDKQMDKIKMIYKTLLLTGIATVMMLVGCSKRNIEQGDSGNGVEGMIFLSSQLLQDDVEQTKAPVNGNPAVNIPALPLYFARVDEGSNGTYADYGDIAFKATRATGKGADPMAVTWATGSEQYYQTNGRKTKLTAWYPGGASATDEASGNGYYIGLAQRVTWRINGAQDIMTAVAKEGNKTPGGAIGNMAFEHRLSQVQVYLYAEDANAASVWGKVKEVSLNGQRTLCSYDLKADDATGAVTFRGSATSNFKVYENTTGIDAPLTKGNAALLGTTMIEPQGASYLLKLSVTTVGGGTQSITLTGQAFEVSKAYKLYLKLEQTAIAPSATIVAWKTPENKDLEVDKDELFLTPAIGQVRYGGIVFWVDPNKPTRYKILSLDKSGGLSWAKNHKYVIGSTGQSMSNGSDNFVAIKAYSRNNTTNSDPNKQTTGVFATDFPAANFCHQKVYGWYFPARDELSIFSSVYRSNNNKPLFDANISSNGGVAISGKSVWSSSENPENDETSYWLNLGSGVRDARYKNHALEAVRCVRELDMLRPEVEDYFYSDGTWSRDQHPGKAIEGVVFWVDPGNPRHFKIVSRDVPPAAWDGGTNDIGRLIWGPSDILVGANSASNGKANTLKVMQHARASEHKAFLWCYKKNTGLNGTAASAVTVNTPAYQWYLPAQDEMDHLYCAYKGVAPTTWGIRVRPGFHTVTGYPAAWNARFTTPFEAHYHWTSTEGSYVTSSTTIYFPDGYKYQNTGKDLRYIRCAREIILP